MYIRLEQLADELQRIVHVQRFNTETQVVTGVEMFPVRYNPAEDELKPDVLYVCDYRKLRFYDPHLEFPPMLVVMEPGASWDAVFFNDRRMLIVTGIVVTELMAELVRIIYEIGSMGSPLAEQSRMLLACRTTKELLQTGMRIIGNPLILTDERQQIVEWADNGNTGSPYSGILELGYLPVGHMALEEGVRSMQMDDFPFINEGNDEVEPKLPTVMVKRLRNGGRVIGYLHAFQFDRDFAPEDLNVVELLGNLLAVRMHKAPEEHSRDADIRKVEQFFQDILENVYNEEQTLQQQKRMGLKLKRFLYTVVVFVRKSEFVPCVSYYDLTKSMAAMLPDCYGFLFRNSIILLIHSDEEITNFREFMEPVMPIIQKYDMVAGISNPFPSLKVLRQHAFQSRVALKLGTVLHKTDAIYCYRDYAIYYMVELCLKSDNLTDFCLPEVVKLIDRSDRDGGELLNTLKVYLRCGRSKTTTAREMFVHLNTVKYRLQQIQQIMGLDLDNDDNALQILLSFKMLEYRELFQGYESMQM